MKSYASTLVRKDLSRSIYKNGILFTDYFEKIFVTNHNKNFNISITDLRHVISRDKSIILQTDIIKLEEKYYKSKEFYENEEDLYNYAYTKNLFEEDKNLNALSICKIIMDSEEITYAQISKQFKEISDNKINLDLKQVAHYCKELKKYNLVIVKVKSTKNNERVVLKNKAINMYSDLNSNKFNLENNEGSDDSQISDEEANHFEENLNSSLDNKSFYKYSSDPEKIMQMSKEEKSFLKIKNQINMNKNYLENRFSFYVDDICIENNILFHLLLKKEKGLTINEITFLLGLHGREKTTNRILSNMEKNNLIKHLNIRKGKKYEFCFTLREDIMNKIPKNIIAKYDSYQNRKIKSEEEDNVASIPIINKKISTPLIKQNIEKDLSANIAENMKEDTIPKPLAVKPQNNLDKFLNFSNKKNIDSSTSASALTIKTEDKKEIIKKNPAEFKWPIPDKNTCIKTNFQDLNKTDFKFIIDEIISNQNLHKIKNSHKLENSTHLENLSSDTKRKILFEYFNAHLSLFKLKSINDVSYNRYIFTLNKLNENKFITVNELKAFILNELEKTIGFVIDRRTIKNLLVNLEKLGLIKTLEFELTMRNKLYNYMKNAEITQKKIVSISREIDVNDDVVEKFKEILVTRHTKVTSSEIYFNEQKVNKFSNDEDEEFNEIIDRKNIEDFLGNNFENSKNSQTKNSTLKTYPVKIQEEIENLTSSLNLKITYDQKSIFGLLEKIIPIEAKYNKKYSKFFFENWKRLYFVKENLVNLFSRKAKKFMLIKSNLDDEHTDQLPIHKIFSNSSLAKVIVPKFLKDKLLKKNNSQVENNYCNKIETIDSYFDSRDVSNNCNTNIADLITQRNFEFNSKVDETAYNYQMIDYFNLEKYSSNFLKNSKLNASLNKEEQKFAKKYFKTGLDFNEDNELKIFLKNKKNREPTTNVDNYLLYLTKLPQKNITKKDKKFNTALYKKILDLIPLLRKIYFNPKIKIKKLSNLLPTVSISSDILLYLNKLGIVKLTRDERRIEDNFTNNFNSWEILRNDVSLEMDERSLIFFDI